MVRVVAIIALIVCSGVAEAQTHGSMADAKSPSLLTVLRDLLGVKPTKTAIRPPARIAGVTAKPPVAAKPVHAAMRGIAATTALAPVAAGVGMAPAAAMPSTLVNLTAEPTHQCPGQRVMSAFYSEGIVTASGEPFNPDAFAAAHRTLPFGTQVMLTNPRNGRSVTVTVNDRGPFVTGVALDLTVGAARAIGMTGAQMLCMW
jgi:rare lipoprotein A